MGQLAETAQYRDLTTPKIGHPSTILALALQGAEDFSLMAYGPMLTLKSS
jgi:hypothetical protein